MKITQVEYGRTINVGKYESVRITLTSTVEESESYKQVLEELKEKMDSLETKSKREYRKQIEED